MNHLEEADRYLLIAKKPRELVSERQVAASIAVAHLLAEVVESFKPTVVTK